MKVNIKYNVSINILCLNLCTSVSILPYNTLCILCTCLCFARISTCQCCLKSNTSSCALMGNDDCTIWLRFSHKQLKYFPAFFALLFKKKILVCVHRYFMWHWNYSTTSSNCLKILIVLSTLSGYCTTRWHLWTHFITQKASVSTWIETHGYWLIWS